MKRSVTPEGILLRIERLRQGKEQKEICTGVCAVSTLSKIETGRQNADPDMLEKLYRQLGIHYTCDEAVLGRLRTLIDEFFEQCAYQRRLTAFDALRRERTVLRHSPLAADWLVICLLMNETDAKGYTGGEDALSILSQCQDYLDRRQKGWYLLVRSYQGGPDSVEYAREAVSLLSNSFARTALLYAYYMAGRYRDVLTESEQTASQALQEGNLWALAECYNMRGTVYACFNMEDMMLTEYKRAARLLSETRWQSSLRTIFYNIGATYLGIERFGEAETYLEKAGAGPGAKDEGNGAETAEETENGEDGFSSRFLLLHKLALLHWRTGRKTEAAKELDAMKKLILAAREEAGFGETSGSKEISASDEKDSWEIHERIWELTALELSSQADSDEYLSQLEELMEIFRKCRRFGYMMFYHYQLRRLYTGRRLYRKAFLLEQTFSDIQKNSSL